MDFGNFVDKYLVWLGGIACTVLVISKWQQVTTGLNTLTGGASTFISTIARG